MDASIVVTMKQDALFSYQGSQSFQPLSVRWTEMALWYGRNCGMGMYRRLIRICERSRSRWHITEGVVKVYFRSDTAALSSRSAPLLSGRAE